MKIIAAFLLFITTMSVNAQDITNTIGNGGFFYIKNVSDTFLALQSNGYLGLGTTAPNDQLEITKNFRLPNTSDAGTGVIYKGSQSFLHNYKNPLTSGHNVFLGVNSGNFSLQHVNPNPSDGSFNTGVGDNTLIDLTTGNNNTAIGYVSLSGVTNGNRNTAVGSGAGQVISSGSFNTAIGFQALIGCESGNNNTALGFSAGVNNISGSNNLMIGFNSQSSTSTVSNEITLGNASISQLRCNVTSITSLSDRRDKKNIQNLSLGLDFISKLKPRQFNWDKREWYKDNVSDGSKTEKKFTGGFIAQELDSVQTEEGAEWLGLVYKSNPKKLEATYGNLLPVIVKAIQELNSKNDAAINELNLKYNAEINELNSKHDSAIMELKNENSGLKKQYDLLAKKINDLSIILKTAGVSEKNEKILSKN